MNVAIVWPNKVETYTMINIALDKSDRCERESRLRNWRTMLEGPLSGRAYLIY